MKKIIILIGGPGCGKGTVAASLLAAHKFNYLETGAMFRTLPADSEIQKLIANGEFIPDTYVCDLIESKINSDLPVLMDGFPRTLHQAKWLVKKYAADFDIRVIHLNLSEDVMAQRIMGRFAAGSGRDDDRAADIIKTRIKNFNLQTRPAIDWLRDCECIKFCDIDAAPAADQYIPMILLEMEK